VLAYHKGHGVEFILVSSHVIVGIEAGIAHRSVSVHHATTSSSHRHATTHVSTHSAVRHSSHHVAHVVVVRDSTHHPHTLRVEATVRHHTTTVHGRVHKVHAVHVVARATHVVHVVAVAATAVAVSSHHAVAIVVAANEVIRMVGTQIGRYGSAASLVRHGRQNSAGGCGGVSTRTHGLDRGRGTRDGRFVNFGKRIGLVEFIKVGLVLLFHGELLVRLGQSTHVFLQMRFATEEQLEKKRENIDKSV